MSKKNTKEKDNSINKAATFKKIDVKFDKNYFLKKNKNVYLKIPKFNSIKDFYDTLEGKFIPIEGYKFNIKSSLELYSDNEINSAIELLKIFYVLGTSVITPIVKVNSFNTKIINSDSEYILDKKKLTIDFDVIFYKYLNLKFSGNSIIDRLEIEIEKYFTENYSQYFNIIDVKTKKTSVKKGFIVENNKNEYTKLLIPLDKKLIDFYRVIVDINSVTHDITNKKLLLNDNIYFEDDILGEVYLIQNLLRSE